MKVKLIFNVELEQIPFEISKRFENLELPQHKDIIINIIKLCEKKDIVEVLNQIDMMRKQLVEYDSTLNDYAQILASYQRSMIELYHPTEMSNLEPLINQQPKEELINEQTDANESLKE